MRVGLFLLAVTAAYADSATEVLVRARGKILAALERMPNYTCVQTLNRDYLKRTTPWGSCGGEEMEPGGRISIARRPGVADTTIAGAQRSTSAGSKLELWTTDRFRLDVRFGSDGREIYSWAGARQFDVSGIQQIVATGAVTSGAFGPFLINIFGQKETQFTDQGSETADGRTLLKFTYRVPVRASRYDFRSAGRRRFIPYDGAFWIDAISADLVRLEIHSAAMPQDTGVCEAMTSVDFQRLFVSGREYLLPSASVVEISAIPGHYVNTITYSGCREYSSQSTIRFDANEGSAGVPATVRAMNRNAIKRGVDVVLALEQDIDSRKAAAGDIVRAQVVSDAVDKKSKRVIMPAGAIAEGPIVRLEHQWAAPGQFLVAIEWQSLTSAGTTIPFAAVLESGASSLTVSVAELKSGPPAAKPKNLSGGRALIFPTAGGEYAVPRGYKSKWTTR